jgi:23S rRNA (uridine2552-2'-O)-methyltransferase
MGDAFLHEPGSLWPGTRVKEIRVASKTGGNGSAGADAGGAGRGLKVRVKTARGRTVSQTRWLQRQLNDPYVAAARRDGYRSRAAYKLAEMDDKFHLLRPGALILDLGATPGGWTQIAVARTNADPAATGKRGRVVAVDINPMDSVPGSDFLLLDFLDPEAPELVRALLGGAPDVVLSDMAAPATGHRPTDHLKIVALCEIALDFAVAVLAPGGAFVAKVLQGGTEGTLLTLLKKNFTQVRHAKPKASRADSAEMYVVATGFRPATEPEPEDTAP